MTSTKKTPATATTRSPFDKLAGPAQADLNTYRRARWIAEKLGVTPRTVRRWYERGHIPQFKLNQRLVLYRLGDIAQLLEEGRIKAITPINGAEPNSEPEVKAE